MNSNVDNGDLTDVIYRTYTNVVLKELCKETDKRKSRRGKNWWTDALSYLRKDLEKAG